MTSHADAIAAWLATWDDPLIEKALFGTADPTAIADAVARFCVAHLGAAVLGARFVRSSIGSVHGLVLEDGRSIVLKLHRADVPLAALQAFQRVQAHLAAHGFAAPRPLLEARPFAHGNAWVESFLDRGRPADAHERPVAKAIATSLAELSAFAEPFVSDDALPLGALVTPDGLWPTPHSPLFDFAKTTVGAERIDDVARAARAVLDRPEGRTVVGHSDWRMEHLRFEGDPPRVVAAYDWDSLKRGREPALVGAAAHGFTADWEIEGRRQAPTLEEARAFVTDYESARGAAFTRAERTTMGAAFAYACAYTARCGHALNPRGPHEPGGFRELVHREAQALLDL